jgi:hypothetical protein
MCDRNFKLGWDDIVCAPHAVLVAYMFTLVVVLLDANAVARNVSTIRVALTARPAVDERRDGKTMRQPVVEELDE